MATPFIEVPPDRLSEEVLQAVIEAFINREGTDYGEREFSLAEKVEQVRRRLQRGEVALVFDPETESCTLLGREELIRAAGGADAHTD